MMTLISSLNQRVYQKLEAEHQALSKQYALIRDSVYQSSRYLDYTSIWHDVVNCLNDRLDELRDELKKLQCLCDQEGWQLQKKITEELIEECWISMLVTRSRLLKYLPVHQNTIAS